MQQSVLITGCRGPDTLHKDHIAKVLCRWVRRCFLIRAFDKSIAYSPYTTGGGSFTAAVSIAGGSVTGCSAITVSSTTTTTTSCTAANTFTAHQLVRITLSSPSGTSDDWGVCLTLLRDAR
jgi:hypothetical protein